MTITCSSDACTDRIFEPLYFYTTNFVSLDFHDTLCSEASERAVNGVRTVNEQVPSSGQCSLHATNVERLPDFDRLTLSPTPAASDAYIYLTSPWNLPSASVVCALDLMLSTYCSGVSPSHGPLISRDQAFPRRDPETTSATPMSCWAADAPVRLSRQKADIADLFIIFNSACMARVGRGTRDMPGLEHLCGQ